ncbi:class I SAM-dependent methyltransferase [Chryseolinea sp. T2]|uniref:class I SAM-dependent methyltransferase n=1 Tax=Chryseolinea sp. T2 TaxID=3129255 RepID=UPI0030782BD1
MPEKATNYDSWHGAHVADNDIDTPWHNFAKAQVQKLAVNNSVILEIGCGRGGFSNFIVNKYPDIKQLFACDYSPTAIEIGRANAPKTGKITWQQEDIQKLSFSEQTFDVIISCETIEHVPHPLLALKEMHRVLKTGGTLILTCPNYFNLFGIWCLYRKVIRKPYTEGGQPYVNYIQLPSIFARLKSLGFEFELFKSSELVLPARVPKTYFRNEVPGLWKYFGSRTFYRLKKT